MLMRGLDVSSYQGVVDWPAVAAQGYRFAIVKIAEGLGIAPDAQAERNLTGARAADLVVGGYFFLHVERDIPTQLALHQKLAREVGFGQTGDLPPAMDLESPENPAAWPGLGLTAEIIRSRALVYLEGLKAWSPNQTPLLYTDLYYWQACGGVSDPRFSAYALWAASYNVNAWPIEGQKPLVFRPWTAWAFWQWSDKVKLPSGAPTDADVYWGTETDLQAILKRDENVATSDPAIEPGTDVKT